GVPHLRRNGRDFEDENRRPRPRRPRLGSLQIAACGFAGIHMNPWLFLIIGYPVTIAIETPILLLGLSPRHPMSRRLFAGIWLTACTYPIVVLIMPPLLIGADG